MDEQNEMTLTQKIGAWGRLLRLPNLFTAPWDPLCGFLIAGGMLNTEKTIYLAVAAFCAYAFGLVTNDIADLKIDKEQRPERPLPSGQISMKAATIGALVFCVVALELASFAGNYTCFGMMMLLVAILLYNYCGRRHALLSPALMALCRVLSAGVGVLAVYPEIPRENGILCALFGAGYFLFILGISLVARRETEALDSRPGRFLLPLGAFLAGGAAAAWIASLPFHWTHPEAYGLLLLFFVSALLCAYAFGKPVEPPALQKKIGFLIRTLILMQCAVILPMHPISGIIVICCFPAAVLASRKFYGS